jgi:hypothetical protein
LKDMDRSPLLFFGKCGGFYNECNGSGNSYQPVSVDGLTNEPTEVRPRWRSFLFGTPQFSGDLPPTVAAQTSPRFLGWCSALLMAKQEQSAAPPMTLGNMRELAVRGWHRRLAELRRERFIGASSCWVEIAGVRGEPP